MQKNALVYDLNTLVSDDLAPQSAEIAEELGRSDAEIGPLVEKSAASYAKGAISQGEHWEDLAFKLGLDDIDLFTALALRTAAQDNLLLGRVRAQSPLMVLGLVSDATPDWVGHWRRILELDRLFHANIIDSELEGRQTYGDLLKLAAERLQRKPADVRYVGNKPAQLEAARAAGMPVIDLSGTTDYPTAFAGL